MPDPTPIPEPASLEDARRLVADYFASGIAFMTSEGRHVPVDSVVVSPDGSCATDHEGRLYNFTPDSTAAPSAFPDIADVDAPAEWHYLAMCPGCRTGCEYAGPAGTDIGIEDWNGETYRFKCCGHRAHLGDPADGGCETWKQPRT